MNLLVALLVLATTLSVEGVIVLAPNSATQYINVSFTGSFTINANDVSVCVVSNSSASPYFAVPLSVGASVVVSGGATTTLVCTATVLNPVPGQTLYICMTTATSANNGCTSGFTVSNAMTVPLHPVNAIFNKTFNAGTFKSNSNTLDSGATVTVSSTNSSITPLAATGLTCSGLSVGTGSSFSTVFSGGSGVNSVALSSCTITASSASAFYICVTDTFLNQFVCSNSFFVSNAVVSWSVQVTATALAGVAISTGTATTSGSATNSLTITASNSNTTYGAITPSASAFSCTTYSGVATGSNLAISSLACVFKTVGTFYLCARDTYGNSAVVCSNSIIITPAAVNTATIAASPNTAVTTATSVALTITMVDQYANTVTSNADAFAIFATLNATTKVKANVLSCTTPSSLTATFVAGSYSASGCKFSSAGSFYFVVNDTTSNIVAVSGGALSVAAVTPSASGASITSVSLALVVASVLASFTF